MTGAECGIRLYRFVIFACSSTCGSYYEAFHEESYLASCSHDFFQSGLSLRSLHLGARWLELSYMFLVHLFIEPSRGKTNTVAVRPAKTQISLGICPVKSEPSLCAQCVA